MSVLLATSWIVKVSFQPPLAVYSAVFLGPSVRERLASNLFFVPDRPRKPLPLKSISAIKPEELEM